MSKTHYTKDEIENMEQALEEHQEMQFKIQKLEAENKLLREGLWAATLQLEGMVLTLKANGNDLNVGFLIAYYEKCASDKREILSRLNNESSERGKDESR